MVEKTSNVFRPASSNGGGGARGPPPGELLAEQLQSVRLRQVVVAPRLLHTVDQLSEDMVVRVGMFAYVHRRERQPEWQPRPNARSTRLARSALHRAGTAMRREPASDRRATHPYPDSHARGGGGPPRQRARVFSSFCSMQVTLSRYGSSAFSRRKRGSTSGSAWRSRSTLSRSAGDARRSASRSTDRCGAPRRCRARRGWRTCAA